MEANANGLIDEQIVFSQLDDKETAIWSLLLASGYLKITKDYDSVLVSRGVSRDRIRHYGFAFEGKSILIG